jgi:hypothetical protein
MRGIGSGRVQPGGIAPDDQQSAVGANSPTGPSARRVALEKRRWRWDSEATTSSRADRIWGGAAPGIRRGDGGDHGPKYAIRLSAKGVSMDR